MPDKVSRHYPMDGGMVDASPPHAIPPNACSYLKNMRVWRRELRSAKGYAAETTATIRGAITGIQGLFAGTRSDGTADLIAAANGGYWRIVGDAKTLISKFISTQRTSSSVTEVSANLVTGNASCAFDTDLDAGDMFWISADDRETYMAEVSAVDSQILLTLTGNYAGTTAGAYTAWRKQADARTRATMFLDRWFFVNGTNRVREWESVSGFRDTGLTATVTVTTTATVTAVEGGLTASYHYEYRPCFQDANGMYGNSIAAVSAETTTTGEGIIVEWDPLTCPTWVTAIRLYRTVGASGLRIQPSTPAYYLVTAAVSAGTYTDDGSTDTLDMTELQPTRNLPAPAGLEDIVVFQDRLVAVSGGLLYISGLPPTDVHTDTAGRYEPDYWYYTLRIGYGEKRGNTGLLVLRGNLYILTGRSVWRVIAASDDPDTWQMVNVLPNVGCESRYTIAQAGDVAYWLGRIRGRLTVVSFDGQNVASLGEPVMGTLDDAKVASLSAACGACGQGFYWLSFEKGDSTWTTLEYNSDRGDGQGSWALRDWDCRAYAQAEGKTYGGFADGLINELESGYSNAGTAIDYDAHTAADDFAEPEWKKHWHSSQTEIEAVTGTPTLTAHYRADEGSWLPAATTGYNVSAAQGTTVMDYRGVETAAAGRRFQRRYQAAGSDIDFIIRGIVNKGESEERDVD